MSMMILGPDKNQDQQKENFQPPEKKKYPFSKVLLIQESILIWLVTLACLVMAFICIFTGSFVELPWITAMVGCPWAAYAITQNAYYRKASIENQKNGIIYEQMMIDKFGNMVLGAENPNDINNSQEIPVG